MIEWIKKFFSKTEKPDVGLGSSIYSNWTIQTTGHWMEHFNVESEAQANGSMDLPPSESTSPDQFHGNVKNEFDRFKSTKKNEIDIQIHSLDTTLGKLIDNQDTFSQLELKYTTKIRAVQTDNEVRIKNANESVKASRADLTNFKRNNKLTRPAKPMTSNFLFFMIIVVILIAETVVNGVFLGENLVGSSAQGAFYALMFSFVNVSVGLVLAPLIRNINHVKTGAKLFGYFVGLIWLSAITVINLLIGHLRDALTVPGSQGMADAYKALDAFRENPFILAEPISYALVAIGMVFALIALLDSFFHSDTYPGYGKKSLQMEEFEENLLAYKMEANDKQEELYSKFVAEGNKLMQAATAHITNLQQTIGFIDLRIREEYRDYFENLAGSFEAVIEQYRTSNIEARDSDAPKYFQDNVTFSWKPLDNQSLRIRSESEEFKKVRSRAEELLRSWPDIQANVRNIRKEY